MESTNHYLTYAVIFVTDKNYGEVPYCSVDYGELEGNAIIRKLCFCGSPIAYDHDDMSWVCSMSGETVCSASQESALVGRSYSEPLISMTISTDPNLYLSELNHPEKDSHILLSEERQVHVFVRIPPKKVWMISDPLPVGNYFTTNLLDSDLIVEWNLEIGFDLPGSIHVTIPLNVFNVAHKDYLGILASGAEAYFHFLKQDSLSIIAHKRIIPNDSYLFVVREALKLAERLPNKPDEREEALRDLTEEREWLMVETAYKLGLPQCTEFLRFFLRKGPSENFPAHAANCHLCRKFFPIT